MLTNHFPGGALLNSRPYSSCIKGVYIEQYAALFLGDISRADELCLEEPVFGEGFSKTQANNTG